MMTIEERILQLVKLQQPQNPLAYVQDIVKDYSLEKLRQVIAADESVVDKNTSRSIIKGNANASIMVISDRPSTKQLSSGFFCPLEGTGELELLDKVWSHFDIDDQDLIYVNAVYFATYKQAGSDRLDRIPSKSEIEACVPYLNYLIDIVRPKAILLLGPIVSNIFKKEAFSKVRGEWIEAKGYPAMITYHPNALIRDQEMYNQDDLQEKKDDFVHDIQSLIECVNNN